MTGLLAGIRVLDFTQVIAGPACTRMMAELGAEVIKVEPAPGGDMARGLPVIREGRSAYFCQQNIGKRSLGLDLRQAAARQILARLVRESDVVIENYSPGTIARLGFGWPQVQALNPRAIMCSISAFGQSGPLSALPGFDYIAQAVTGVASMIGEPDRAPAVPGLAVGDVGTGVTAFGNIAAALFRRERDGQGRYIDVAISEFYFYAHEINVQSVSLGESQPHRNGSQHGAATPLGVFATADGYVYIVVLQPMWARLCRAMQRPDLEADPRFATAPARVAHAAALLPIVEAWFAGLSRAEALRRLEAARVPAAPVLSVAEAVAHPHLVERGAARRIDDPVLGEFVIPGLPMRLQSGDLGPPPAPAPFLGQHNRQILERAGFDAAEIGRWQADGTLVAEALPPSPGAGA